MNGLMWWGRLVPDFLLILVLGAAILLAAVSWLYVRICFRDFSYETGPETPAITDSRSVVYQVRAADSGEGLDTIEITLNDGAGLVVTCQKPESFEEGDGWVRFTWRNAGIIKVVDKDTGEVVHTFDSDMGPVRYSVNDVKECVGYERQ